MKNEHGEYEYRTTITIMDVEIDVDLLMVDDFSMRDTITITLDNEQTALLQEAIEMIVKEMTIPVPIGNGFTIPVDV